MVDVNKKFLSLLLNNRELIKLHMPTEKQAIIIQHIRKVGSVTSYDIEAKFDLSPSSASKVLIFIHRKGYLKRRNIGCDKINVAGWMYEYSCKYAFSKKTASGEG